MDAHFSKILAPIDSKQRKDDASFIPRAKYTGSIPGYIFQMGNRGIGYYKDTYYSFDAKSSDHDLKVTVDNAPQEIQDERPKKRKADEVGLESEEVSTMEKLLADAEKSGITQLDASGLKSLLVNFEKKITKNQKMRMKYPNEPEKFLESEVELHAEIQELHAVAASPELYYILVDTKAVNSILGMITHDNTDISIGAVSLLQEMTDVDLSSEDEDERASVMQFVEAFIASQGLELIVQNLTRLDESNDEDAQGVYNTMGIIENLVELLPNVGVDICRRTNILAFLLQRVKAKKFDANKLYASELMSILLQSSLYDAESAKESKDVPIQVQLCNMKLLEKDQLEAIDGMDALLQAIAQYRKKEVTAADEQECVENLFLVLSSVLSVRDNQFKFLASEGFELMMRCLKEQQYAAGCAINAIKYAVMRNKACCERFVDVGGLKYVFPLLTGRGVKKHLKRKGTGEKRNVEETAISVIAQLCSQLHSSKMNDYSMRLLNKFIENEKEKLERCVELFVMYYEQLEKTDDQLQAEMERLEEEGAEEELEQLQDEENIHMERLDGGLFYLQEVALIIAFACIFDSHHKDCLVRAASKFSAASFDLINKDGSTKEELSMNVVLNVLRNYAAYLRNTEEEEQPVTGDSSNSISGVDGQVNIDKDLNRKFRILLTEWSAGLTELLKE